MSLERFEILLDDGIKEYRPGQIISGKIVIKANEEIKCEGLTLKFKGHAYVRFTSGTENDEDTFTDSEVFFEFKEQLMGDGKNEIRISPGHEHVYEFTFQIPLQPLPANFKKLHGKVEYFLKGVVKRSLWKLNITTLQSITILPELDQDLVLEAALPSEIKTSKTFGFMCCTSGPLYLNVRVPRRVCVPGETILFEVEVNNMSRNRIADLSAQIFQKVYLTGKHLKREKTSTSHASFNEIRRGHGVVEGDCDTWCDELLVPLVPPTKLGGGCKFIDVQYFILVTAHVADLCAINPKALCPILIST
ncbi:Arrestin domain-containing protein 3, partial [Orchesella cincta]